MAKVTNISNSANITRIEVEDNSDEVLKELNKKIELALEAIGGEAERFAKGSCPVLTGRLKNSITFATPKMQSSPNQEGGARAESEDYKKTGSPEPNTVYVGTNVVYAPFQEYYGRKAHFLRNSITQHNARWKELVEAALED